MRYGLIALTLLLGACATTPVPLRGEFPAVTPLQAQDRPPVGTAVRWGGDIIEVEPRALDTCVEILARPLESWARPRDTRESLGRFLACTPGFLDPEIFRREREVTVVGRVTGVEERPVGEYDYPYPVLQASEIYLWAPRVERVYYPYRGPYWHPWWGPYWGPAWYYGYPWHHRWHGYGAWGWYWPYP